jgi:hypothetical protein
MSGKPSRIKQREIQQFVKGAMKGGATKVVVRLGEACIEAHLPGVSNGTGGNHVPPDCNNSFDKIMRDH